MADAAPDRATVETGKLAWRLADRALSRMAGAPLIPGNSIRLLRNGEENYPAWMEAIRQATRVIHFETYFMRADRVGLEFASLLEQKAREGVKVRLIYDWFGGLGAATFFFWWRLRKAGVEIRCFHPPRLDDPIESLSRDHRKIVVVDGNIAFVSGLCVGKNWVGDAARDIAPWRDTGACIQGPAVHEVDRSFRRMWNSMSRRHPISDSEESQIVPAAGSTPLRIVSGAPGRGGLYRLDMLMAALAQRFIWLTDAYFFATPAYIQSLRAAAQDGVDVRILLPRTSDIPVVRAMSRVGYRTLLEAGVRIFEWNGTMLHAKTAVVDGIWSRVGSTNLNIASWLSNYELDVVVEDQNFSRSMKEMYLEDLENATEIVLVEKARVRPREERRPQRRGEGAARRSAGRAATGVMAMGSTAGAAFARSRLLGPAEAPIMAGAAAVLLSICILAILFPHSVSMVVTAGCGWMALVLLFKSVRLRRLGMARRQETSQKGVE
jgi:cardiolipin synthase A/B